MTKLQRALNHLLKAQKREKRYERLRWVVLWRGTVERIMDEVNV